MKAVAVTPSRIGIFQGFSLYIINIAGGAAMGGGGVATAPLSAC